MDIRPYNARKTRIIIYYIGRIDEKNPSKGVRIHSSG
jgi:hypothetical protein